jgi:CBS domain-containing protein
MHAGIYACDPQTPLAGVAKIMASRRVHALVVHNDDGNAAEIVSDTDVIAAAACADAFTARHIAGTEVLSVSMEMPLREAARLMAEHSVSHLIVNNRANGTPVGVLSTTDILAAYSAADADATL